MIFRELLLIVDVEEENFAEFSYKFPENDRKI